MKLPKGEVSSILGYFRCSESEAIGQFVTYVKILFYYFVSHSPPFCITEDNLMVQFVNIFFSIISGISEKDCRIAIFLDRGS
jgi:hypothetical protein